MSSKILIADDSKLVVSLIKSLFAEHDNSYVVIEAVNGREAIEKALSEEPDVILMDWQMPEMSGIDALKTLKSDIRTKEIPVIMLTASEATTEAFECGASDFVQKPFNKNELIARVNTTLDAVNARKELKKRLVDIEIEKDRLKLQKEVLIRQRKEMLQSVWMASQVHRYLFANSELLHQMYPDSLYLSMPVSEVPATFFWSKVIQQNLYFCLIFHENTGVQSVLYASIFKKFIEEYFQQNIMANIDLVELLKKLESSVDSFITNEEIAMPYTEIIFCSLDYSSNTLNYAGVNTSLFALKRDKLVELKSERSASGFFTKDLEIVPHKIQLAKQDILYLLNDGFLGFRKSYPDSYLSDELMELLRTVSKEDIKKQGKMLQKTFEHWKTDLKQQTDMAIVGIRL